MDVGAPPSVNIDRRKKPCSANDVPALVKSMLAKVLRTMLSNVNGAALVIPAADGFHVSVVVVAALAAAAPESISAAVAAFKYFPNCIFLPFAMYVARELSLAVKSEICRNAADIRIGIVLTSFTADT